MITTSHMRTKHIDDRTGAGVRDLLSDKDTLAYLSKRSVALTDRLNLEAGLVRCCSLWASRTLYTQNCTVCENVWLIFKEEAIFTICDGTYSLFNIKMRRLSLCLP